MAGAEKRVSDSREALASKEQAVVSTRAELDRVVKRAAKVRVSARVWNLAATLCYLFPVICSL